MDFNSVWILLISYLHGLSGFTWNHLHPSYLIISMSDDYLSSVLKIAGVIILAFAIVRASRLISPTHPPVGWLSNRVLFRGACSLLVSA